MQCLTSNEIAAVSGGDFTIGTSGGTIEVYQEDLGNGSEAQIWVYPDGHMVGKVVRSDSKSIA